MVQTVLHVVGVLTELIDTACLLQNLLVTSRFQRIGTGGSFQNDSNSPFAKVTALWLFTTVATSCSRSTSQEVLCAVSPASDDDKTRDGGDSKTMHASSSSTTMHSSSSSSCSIVLSFGRQGDETDIAGEMGIPDIGHPQ